MYGQMFLGILRCFFPTVSFMECAYKSLNIQTSWCLWGAECTREGRRPNVKIARIFDMPAFRSIWKSVFQCHFSDRKKKLPHINSGSLRFFWGEVLVWLIHHAMVTDLTPGLPVSCWPKQLKLLNGMVETGVWTSVFGVWTSVENQDETMGSEMCWDSDFFWGTLRIPFGKIGEP